MSAKRTRKASPDNEPTSSPMILATIRMSSSTRCCSRADEKDSYSTQGCFDFPFSCTIESSKSESLACGKGSQLRWHRWWEAAYVEATIRIIGVTGVAVRVVVGHGRVLRWALVSGKRVRCSQSGGSESRRGWQAGARQAARASPVAPLSASDSPPQSLPSVSGATNLRRARASELRHVFRHAHCATPLIFYLLRMLPP